MTGFKSHRLGRVAVAVVIATLALILLAGCSAENVAEKIANEALKDEGVKVDLDKDGGGTIEGKDGKLQVGEDVDLPDGFPKSVPIHDKGKVTAATASNGDTFFLTMNIDASKDDVIKFYKDGMKENGWNLTQEILTTAASAGSNGAMLAYNNGKQEASVTIAEMEDGKVAVTIGVSPSASATDTTAGQ